MNPVSIMHALFLPELRVTNNPIQGKEASGPTGQRANGPTGQRAHRASLLRSYDPARGLTDLYFMEFEGVVGEGLIGNGQSFIAGNHRNGVMGRLR